jgi:hypothetical protein
MLMSEGSGVSALSAGIRAMFVELGGICDGREAVFVYPSSDSANDDPRYHCTTCSGLGRVAFESVSLSKPANVTMLSLTFVGHCVSIASNTV